MAWLNCSRTVRCGSVVRETDGRHEARVASMQLANHVPYILKVRWLDSGWVSELFVSDIEVVRR